MKRMLKSSWRSDPLKSKMVAYFNPAAAAEMTSGSARDTICSTSDFCAFCTSSTKTLVVSKSTRDAKASAALDTSTASV
ncbi:hypothetical protein ATCV1_z137R [Acanthocystis turfacea chlorella virus 1]|uniref:Uncharacterized protein z137R n=1 Tax=Chlorovirus heliozoae TaxID=322019 RepID=A7K897_9PHYC|nr:hypothetical protein ATCV1_z137R [Acanthocystis turfacea chlorella virus 1]ABT16271.1 hypothetical protein ATCV1_z137R [Acanthocystis turfacea chlorella virus 1]